MLRKMSIYVILEILTSMWRGYMKLIKQSKTKLNLIRLEGLCKLILNKYDEDDVVCWDCQK